MLSIESNQSAFWNALTAIGECRYRFDFPACRFVGNLDLGSSQMIDGELLIPEGGVSLKTEFFQEAFFDSGEAILEMVSESRKLKFSIQPVSEEGGRKLGLLARTFCGSEDDDRLEVPELDVPCLCPCCQEAAKANKVCEKCKQMYAMKFMYGWLLA